MSKMFQVYGIGQALIPVLPPPLPFETPPTSNQTNYEIGQLVFSPPRSPTAFYFYAGAGNWVEFATNSGAITSIVGTTNQLTANTVAGVATISLPTTLVAPGSVTATTTLTATLGNITATNGNLVLGTAGNKLVIATGSNASVGTSAAMTSGTVTVANTSVTANSQIFVQPAVLGTVTSPQAGYVSAKSAGVSFTITSAGGTDTSTWNYWIIN